MQITQTRALQIEPAKCNKAASVASVLKGDFEDHGLWAQEKFDGIRYLLQVRPNGSKQNYLTSRRISVVTHFFVEKQDSRPEIRDYVFPKTFDGAVFDGEIVPAKGGISSDTQHAMASGEVVYKVFDLLALKGESLVNLALEARLDHLSRLLKLSCSPLPKWFQQVGYPNCPTSQVLAEVLARGGEGVILKSPTAPYGYGWTKVKKQQAFDCVITGVEWSTEGKYKQNGWIKNICIGQHLVKHASRPSNSVYTNKGFMVEVGRASGMDDKLRAEISASPDKFIGRVVTVEAQERLPSLKFRHPRFVRFHDDKTPEMCWVEDDERVVPKPVKLIKFSTNFKKLGLL